jgi:hypothetical protein
MNGKSLFNSFRSPKPDMFVGTLTVENNEATGGTMKPWVTSVAESSGIYTITFGTGITFPVVPVFTVTAVSTNGTAISAYATITQQYVNSTRTIKYKLWLADGTAAGAAADLFANIILIGTTNSGT